jgi:hypothetical protein
MSSSTLGSLKSFAFSTVNRVGTMMTTTTVCDLDTITRVIRSHAKRFISIKEEFGCGANASRSWIGRPCIHDSPESVHRSSQSHLGYLLFSDGKRRTEALDNAKLQLHTERGLFGCTFEFSDPGRREPERYGVQNGFAACSHHDHAKCVDLDVYWNLFGSSRQVCRRLRPVERLPIS